MGMQFDDRDYARQSSKPTLTNSKKKIRFLKLFTDQQGVHYGCVKIYSAIDHRCKA